MSRFYYPDKWPMEVPSINQHDCFFNLVYFNATTKSTNLRQFEAPCCWVNKLSFYLTNRTCILYKIWVHSNCIITSIYTLFLMIKLAIIWVGCGTSLPLPHMLPAVINMAGADSKALLLVMFRVCWHYCASLENIVQVNLLTAIFDSKVPFLIYLESMSFLIYCSLGFL